MTKNKKPFWKKLIGKNKSSISSLKSEPNLLYDNKKEPAVENRRLSGLFFYHIPNSPPSPIPTKKRTVELKEQQPLKEKDTSITVISTEQPNVTPTLFSSSGSNQQQDNESNSSFVVVDKTHEEIERLQSIIDSLKSELENEKATNQALQKQKQAIAKDLDYFEINIDELIEEKNTLNGQLEEEKTKSQQYLDDLNLLLQKMKTNSDNGRELSRVKLELKDAQDKATKDYESHLIELSEKDKSIRELKSKLNQSQEQADTLKETIDDLIKTHAEELSHAEAAAARKESEPVLKHEQPIRKKVSHIPLPNSLKKPNTEQPFTLRMDANHTTKDNGNLDDQLLKLIKEKERLQSSYSKLPLSGGGPKYRRRKDELESMLDQVDSQLSKVKYKIKNVS